MPGAGARPLLLALLGSALAGCFGGKDVKDACNQVAEYQASVDASGIQVPDGLAAPDKGSGYVVPPGTGVELQGAACLARPPPYFRPEPAPAPANQAPARDPGD